MKTFRFLIALFLFFLLHDSKIVASTALEIPSEIYEQQFKLSGADRIKDSLPKESLEHLNNIGLKKGDWKEISKMNLANIISEILKMTNEKFSSPFRSLLPVIAIIIICAMVQGIQPSINEKNITSVLNSVSTLCICICIITPIVRLINSASLTIKMASNFVLCYVPIMTTIMIASGQTISATSYHMFLISAGRIISHLSENFVIPLMSILLGISIISSISPNLKLDSICKATHKLIKITLEFSSSIFIGILTLQNLVTSSADTVGANALKTAINGCVPMIGRTLSDASKTVCSCVKLLKTGIGAFGIIAGGIIFLPVLIECILWITFLGVSQCVGDIFELKRISSLLKSISSVVSTILAVMIFSIVILIISSVIMLIIGGK